MLEERLPVHIDPVRYAETGRHLHGFFAVEHLERLVPLLADNSGQIEVELQFGVDVEGIRYIEGRLKGVVQLTCQRCLGAMELEVDTPLSLGLIPDRELADQLPEYYDPLVYGSEPLFLRDIIEDELILALPVVARHAEGECLEQVEQVLHEEEIEEKSEQPKENPFAVLARLKSNG